MSPIDVQREYQKGDTVELIEDFGCPDLSLGQRYKVLDRTYVGGHADCYVLRVVGDNGHIVTQHEGSFRLVAPCAEGLPSE